MGPEDELMQMQQKSRISEIRDPKIATIMRRGRSD